MIENLTKHRLTEGGEAFGCFIRSPDATFVEYVAAAGWDFLIFDGEHGTVAPHHVGDLVRACNVRNVTPISRVSTNHPALILRSLDAGALGLHVPWVNTPVDAEAAARSARYGPEGVRGLAANRSTDWIANAEVTAAANAETMVVVHIETAQAAEAIDAFLAVDGIDVLFIGPTDLSHSLGHPGEPSHPDVAATIRQVAEAVRGSTKTLGIYAGTPEAVAAGRELGARYFTTGVETLLGPAMRAFLEAVR